MRILITGGHFSPAYSIIAELKRRGYEVSIAGRRHPFEDDQSVSFEYQVCQKENVPFYEIKTGRYQRRFTAYTISSLLKTPSGVVGAIILLKKVRPDIVMTFGGYIGLPIAIASAFLGIRVVLHEQTQGAGLSSKIIARLAQKICISFRSSKDYFPKEKTVFTGNPIRQEIFETGKQFPIPKGKIIYITGGSTGSHFINLAIYEIADLLLNEYVLIHQTGDSKKFDDFERLHALKDRLDRNKQRRYILRKFIYPDEIGRVFASADLILSRAGANIVFEIFATKKMSLLIPLPHGQDNEQLSNAALVRSLGIGEYIDQEDASGKTIVSKITEMFENKEKYKRNMKKTAEFIVPDAAKKIADVVENVYDKKAS